MPTIVGLAERLEPMEEMNEETNTTESDVEGGADAEDETFKVVLGTITGDELIAASDVRPIDCEDVEVIDGADGLPETLENRLVAASEVELITIFDVVPIGCDEDALWLILLDVEAEMLVVGSIGHGIG